MPYKVVGRQVLRKKQGKWKLKQTAKSPAAAQRAVNLLRAIEHGWQPTRNR